MANQCYLAVDLGAESGRVLAGLFDGRTMQLREIHRFPNGPVSLGGTLRWNVLGLWSEIQTGLQKAAAEFGDNIVSVGVDTWGVDYVLFGPQMEILGQPYNYRDSRTDGVMPAALARVPKREVFAATGLQFMGINTLFQLLAMQQRTPQLLAAAQRFLMMPDFFHWCLCGSQVVEFTNATTTQCFHPVKGDWSFELLQKFDLPTGMFPEVVPPGTHLGTLRDDIARRTGLRHIQVVAPATHDTGSAVAAVPTESTGTANWAYISSGTWSLMGLEVAEAVLTDRALELNVTNEGGIDGTYRLLKNIMGLWLVQQCKHSFERGGKQFDYSALQAAASEAPAFRSIVDPDDPEFLNPEDMPTAIANYCRKSDQPVPESEGQFIRCCLESLALKYRTVLNWLEELSGTPVEVIHIVGGGTRNELLNQLTANACGRAVMTGPVEATGLGNALMQARTAGEFTSLAELRTIVRNSGEIQRYEPADAARWREAHERFTNMLARHRRR